MVLLSVKVARIGRKFMKQPMSGSIWGRVLPAETVPVTMSVWRVQRASVTRRALSNVMKEVPPVSWINLCKSGDNSFGNVMAARAASRAVSGEAS